MKGYELIADFRRNKFADTSSKSFYNVQAYGFNALSTAALSYRNAVGPDSKPPVFWPFDLQLWQPRDRITNLAIAGALYQEAAEFKEKQKSDGSIYQHMAIEIAEEINELLAYELVAA